MVPIQSSEAVASMSSLLPGSTVGRSSMVVGVTSENAVHLEQLGVLAAEHYELTAHQ